MIEAKELESSKIRRSKSSVIMILVIGSLLMAISTRYFVISIGLYTPGLAGISNGIAYTTWDIIANNNVDLSINEQQFKIALYWIIYAIANIPIIYLTLKWYSMRFFKLSIFVFVTNLAFTMFLTFVPGFSDASFVGQQTDDGLLSTTTGKIVLGMIGGLFYGVGVGEI